MPSFVVVIIWTAIAIVLVASGLAAWNQIALRRTRILATREPGAVVRISTATPKLFAALEELALSGGVEIPPPTFGVTLVAGSRGVEFWSGWRTPWLYRRIAWGDISGIEATVPGEVDIPGVTFITRSLDRLVRVPVSLTGGWPGGTGALDPELRRTTIELLASQRSPRPTKDEGY
jgi:hypothetical protein